MLKIVDGGEFDVAKRTVAATKLSEGDEVVSVMPLLGQQQIVLQTKEGYFLKFDIEEIPEKKKTAVGVRGMKLGAKDQVDQAYYLTSGVPSVISYHDKELDLQKMKTAKRDGKGTKIRV